MIRLGAAIPWHPSLQDCGFRVARVLACVGALKCFTSRERAKDSDYNFKTPRELGGT